MDQNTPIGRRPSVLLSYAISILGIFLLWLLQHDPNPVLLTRFSGLVSAFGCWSGGLIHDASQSYNPLPAFALAKVVLGMVPFLVVPALRRQV
jgi:hypothetical protein